MEDLIEERMRALVFHEDGTFEHYRARATQEVLSEQIQGACAGIPENEALHNVLRFLANKAMGDGYVF